MIMNASYKDRLETLARMAASGYKKCLEVDLNRKEIAHLKTLGFKVSDYADSLYEVSWEEDNLTSTSFYYNCYTKAKYFQSYLNYYENKKKENKMSYILRPNFMYKNVNENLETLISVKGDNIDDKYIYFRKEN